MQQDNEILTVLRTENDKCDCILAKRNARGPLHKSTPMCILHRCNYPGSRKGIGPLQWENIQTSELGGKRNHAKPIPGWL